MKGTDKFLLGIVVGIVLLVLAAFILTLQKKDQDFLPEDSPAGVTHNYLLAIQQKDYARAYTYLAARCTNPINFAKFEKDIQSNKWLFRIDQDKSLSIEDEEIDGDTAQVGVIESTFYTDGLFGSRQSYSTFYVDLEMQSGAWKIVDAGRYFYSSWDCQ